MSNEDLILNPQSADLLKMPKDEFDNFIRQARKARYTAGLWQNKDELKSIAQEIIAFAGDNNTSAQSVRRYLRNLLPVEVREPRKPREKKEEVKPNKKKV